MDKVRRFQNISSFLKKHQLFWEEEILWNKKISPFLSEMGKSLNQYTEEDLIKLEAFQDYSFIKEPIYRDFFDQIFQLANLPKMPFQEKVPLKHHSSIYLTKKKHHELNQILSIMEMLKPNCIIDYAGGKGASSFFLSHHLDCQSHCIDFDPKLIHAGKTRKNKKELSSDVTFELKDLKESYPVKENALSFSLHNCGELSVLNIQNLSPSSQFLNIPCCFHKGESFNLSSIAKKSPIHYTKQSLHCAAKSYKQLTKEEFRKRESVKKFRYPLELYIQKENLTKAKLATKSKSLSLYQSTFENYCNQLELPQGFNLREASDFQRLETTQNEVKTMIHLGIIRNLFGRLIEVSVCLDRSLYLEESGIKNNLFEIFSNEKSPRNILMTSLTPSY